MIPDRSMNVKPTQTVSCRWVPVELCVLTQGPPMAPEAIIEAGRKLVQLGNDLGTWPPPNGYWRDDGRFVVCDGRHELLARMARGDAQVFVCWLEALAL